MGDRRGVSAGHHGMLVPGDTLDIETKIKFTAGMRKLKWTVSEVRPNQLLALQLRSDSLGELIATRQFSAVTSIRLWNSAPAGAAGNPARLR